MKIEFQLTSSDFLQHQLYTASTSELVRKKRRNSRMVVPLMYIGIGIYFLYTNSVIMSVAFIAVGALWYFLHPLYTRRRYRNFYKKHIAEHFKNRINRNTELSIDSECLYLKDDLNESKISTKEIINLVELRDHFLIRLKTGMAVVVPKNNIYDEDFRAYFVKMNVEYKDERNWEWK